MEGEEMSKYYCPCCFGHHEEGKENCKLTFNKPNPSVFLDFFGKIQEAEDKVEMLCREVQALKKEVAELQMNAFDMAVHYQKKVKK
jgi:hypothetical protein